MGGVGEQTQAVGKDATGDLEQCDEEVETEAEDQPRIGRSGESMILAAVIVHEPSYSRSCSRRSAKNSRRMLEASGDITPANTSGR